MAVGQERDEVERLLAAKKVTLTVEERAGVDRVNWPVSQGVAFPPGVLTNVNRLALCDLEGKPVPMAARPLAWWDRERKAIRFAQVTFAADVRARQKRSYILTWNGPTPVKQPTMPRAVVVEEKGKSLIVKTGEFSVRFSKIRP